MIVKGMRKSSYMMMAVGTMVGLPCMRVVTDPSVVHRDWQWLVWVFLMVSIGVLLRGLLLLVLPPTALETTSAGVSIYYKPGARSFTRNADLLPWDLITGMRMKHVDGRDNTFNWAIEIDLSAAPPFEQQKRDALKYNELFAPSNDTLKPRSFYIDTFVYNLPKESLFELLESSWRKWQRARCPQKDAYDRNHSF